MDPSGNILAASQSFRDSQIPVDDPEGSNFIELLDAESQFKARSFLETLVDRPCLIKLAHRTTSVATRQVTYCFCPTNDFGQTRIIAVGRDQEDPLELVEQLVRLNTELEESRHHNLSTDETTDALTGLGNRRWFFERLNALWRETNRQGTLVWVMLADVDQFKKINQAFGHEMGDELLKGIAQLLQNSVRVGDWVCRYGGDGFLLAGVCTAESELPGLAGRILTGIRGLRFVMAGKSPRITISLGAALAHPSETYQPWVVLQAADRALHRAKEAGRDRYDVEPGVVGRPEGLCAKPNPRFR
jgi:diguanylate cyclase (GGDEF)-like protein